MENGWTKELERLKKENRQFRSVVTNLVDDIAGLKNRRPEDLQTAAMTGNSWFSVIRARRLLGKDVV